MSYSSYVEDDSSDNSSKTAGLIIGIVVIVLVTAVLLYIVHITRPVPVLAPTAYSIYVPDDKSFQVIAPGGWDVDPSSAEGITSSVKFTNQSAHIFVSADLQGSLQADIINSQNAQMQNMASGSGTSVTTTPAVEKIHMAGEADMAQNYPNYNELQMVTFDAKMGEGRVSEFTATSPNFGVGPVHGYRATLLSVDKRISAVAVCRESDWPTLKPVFIYILESIDKGPAS
jgi:hypothetical protein